MNSQNRRPEWLQHATADIHRAHQEVTGDRPTRYRGTRINPFLANAYAEARWSGDVSVTPEIAERLRQAYALTDSEADGDSGLSDERAAELAGAVHTLVHEGEHVAGYSGPHLDEAESDVSTHRTARLAEEAFSELTARELAGAVIERLSLPIGVKLRLSRAPGVVRGYPLITAMADGLVADACPDPKQRTATLIDIGAQSGHGRLETLADAYLDAGDDDPGDPRRAISGRGRGWLHHQLAQAAGLALGAAQDLRYDADGMLRDPSDTEIEETIAEHRTWMTSLVSAVAELPADGGGFVPASLRDECTRRTNRLLTEQLAAATSRSQAARRYPALAASQDYTCADRNALGYRIQLSSLPAVGQVDRADRADVARAGMARAGMARAGMAAGERPVGRTRAAHESHSTPLR